MSRFILGTSIAFLIAGCNATKQADDIDLSQVDFQAISTDFSAHWLSKNVLVLKESAASAALVYSANAKLDEGEQLNHALPLKKAELSDELATRFPHLKDFHAFSLDISESQIKELLKGQLAVVAMDEADKAKKLAYVQHYGVIDQLFTSNANDADEVADYGAVISEDDTQFTLWAPTAKSVSVQLYDQDKSPLEDGLLSLTEDQSTGAWRVSTKNAPQGTFFQYKIDLYHPSTQAIESVSVTDPYSWSLSTNSLYSQVVDLASVETQPNGWNEQNIPQVPAPESHVLYEVHIRDFSAVDSKLSNPAYAGKYKAFSESESDSAKHLAALREAGLNTVHLLPTYDISTVNEDPAQVIYPSDNIAKLCNLLPDFFLCKQDLDPQQSLQSVLKSYDPASSDAQEILEQLRPNDPFNWGYDPFHYTVPEGSYAVNPDGILRIVEFREMVQTLHNKGFRVIMDVVYNHTYEAGLEPKSVLDKIVPNYYHRLNPVTGAIEQSTCCDNSATEHRMMAKLMNDSLVVWAKEYKIDGFRFDLMGHQPKAEMLEARELVREVDPDTYFYGEGWNFGEVANNAQFVQATQLELAGTEIGTFTDRLRDAIRGGSSFVYKDEIRQGQGIGNGLITIPNELQTEENQEAMLAEYYLSMDQVRVGLAANLADFPLINAQGEAVKGRDIDYGGAPAGYALDPADTINYVSKHDNQTIWDNNQYRIAFHVSAEDRTRMQMLSLAYPLLAQGIPFLHMGGELLRSKSYLRDSYDYGDWFNQVDFSKQTNNYNVGLPPKVKDGDNWEIIGRIIKNNKGRDQVTPELIERASGMFMDLIAIRTGTPLFSLTTAQEVIEQVKFHNTGKGQQKGLIVMSIADKNNLDEEIQNIVVVFNNGPESKTFEYPEADSFKLHPRQLSGTDQVVKSSKSDANGFTVPGLTVAVFVN